MTARRDYILDLAYRECENNEIVGTRAAKISSLIRRNIPMLPGCVVPVSAFYDFLHQHSVIAEYTKLLEQTDLRDPQKLRKVSTAIKKKILSVKIPEEISKSLLAEYKTRSGLIHHPTLILTASYVHPLSIASYPFSYSTIKQGETNVLIAVREIFASLFSEEQMRFRVEKKLGHFDIGVAILIQKMIDVDRSGIVFSTSPRNKKSIIIETVYGFHEHIRIGNISPDHVTVEKENMTIMHKHIGVQQTALHLRGTTFKELRVPKKYQDKSKLSEKEAIEVAKLAKQIEKEYYFPQEISFAYEKKNLYVLAVQPLTFTNHKDVPVEKAVPRPVLLTGTPITRGIVTGSVKILTPRTREFIIGPHDIMVMSSFDTERIKQCKKAAGIITDYGGATSYAGTVARDLGIPVIVGTHNATKVLRSDMIITINGNKGEVYEGGYKEYALVEKKQVFNATKLYTYLEHPKEMSEQVLQLCDGIGVLAAEDMIKKIGIHPKKLLRENRKEEFIMALVEQIAKVCEAFTPRPVVYRLSDLSTYEYRKLAGGIDYDIRELNPMLGYHGAFRHIHDPQVAHLELEAFTFLRNKKHYRNVWFMLPFVRTVSELVEMKKLIASAGIYRTPTCKFIMSVETPANIYQLEQYIKVGIDGVAINARRLTALLSGTDTLNPEMLPFITSYDETLPQAMMSAVKTCHRHNIPCTIYSSGYLDSDFLEQCIKHGISGITLSPEHLESAKSLITQTEKKVIGDKL